MLAILFTPVFHLLSALHDPAAVPQSAVECRLWDEAFLSVFNSALLMTLIGALAWGLVLGLLFGRSLWPFTAPRSRILWSGFVWFLLMVFGVVVWPFFGLGLLWFNGVDPVYLQCNAQAFSASGLLGGAIGAGVPAISQVPALLGLLLGATVLGGLGALALSELLARFLPSNLHAKV